MFNRLASALEVRAGEGKIVLLLLAHSFFIGLTRTFADAASNTLFLVQFTPQKLPYLYMGVALALMITGLAYSRLQRRLSLLALLTTTLIFIAAFLCAIRLLLVITDGRGAAFAAAIGFEVIWVLTSLEFWGLAGRIFTVRQGKRLFGLIGTGSVVATIGGGSIVPLAVRLIGTVNLLLLSAASIVIALAIMLRIFGTYTKVVAPPEASEGQRPRDRLRSHYLVLIFAMAALAMMGRYFVDNAFYNQASVQYPNGDQLASFLGVFLAVSGFLTLASRVFSGSLLSRYGVIAGLLILPLLLLIAAGSVTVTGAILGVAAPAVFWLVVTTRMIDRALRYSIHRASVQVLYQPLPSDERLWVQTTSETIIEGIAGGVSGLALLVLRNVLAFGAVQFSYGLVFIVAAWIVVVVRLNRQYVDVLMKALATRRFGRIAPTLQDSSSVTVLKRGLASPYPAEVIYSLNMLESLEDGELDATLIELLAHPLPEVREEALKRIERRSLKMALAAVEARVQDEPVAALRGLALRVWSSLDGDTANPQLVPYLEDSDPQISSGAMIGLLRHGGVEGGSLAGKRLVRLINSSRPEERELGAWVLGESGFGDLYMLLGRLLRDENAQVRRAAVEAACRLRRPELWSAVIDCLASREVCSAAAAGLYGANDSVAPYLERAFAARHHEREVLIRVARVCGHVVSPHVTGVLRKQMAIPDEAVRYHVLAALRARGYRAENGDIAIVQQRIREEVAQATWTLAALEDIGDAEFPFDLLRRSLLHDLEQSQKRALLLLSFIYDSQMISQAQESFNRLSREKSAYAVEIIDMVVSPELKAVLLPLLEDTDRHEQLERLRVYFPQLRLNREERLKDIITSPQASHWSKACALYIVSEALLAGFADVVVAALVLQDSLVREMALWTLFKISPDVFRRSVGASGQSGDPALEKTATQTVRQIERVRRGEKMQLLTIEKVIVLKTVSIFIETPDALLAEIASILKEVEVHAGDHIIEKGDVGNCLYIIAEGEVVVHDGERTITHLGEREVVGELALLDSEPRTASVTAVENGLLLRLDQDAFYELIADYPDIVRGIMRVLARRLRAANQV